MSFACLNRAAAPACIQLNDAFVRLSGLKGHEAPEEFLLPPRSRGIEQNISFFHRYSSPAQFDGARVLG